MCFFLVIISLCLHSEIRLNVPPHVSWLVLAKVGICGLSFCKSNKLCVLFNLKDKHMHLGAIVCLSSPQLHVFLKLNG